MNCSTYLSRLLAGKSSIPRETLLTIHTHLKTVRAVERASAHMELNNPAIMLQISELEERLINHVDSKNFMLFADNKTAILTALSDGQAHFLEWGTSYPNA